MLDGTVGSNVTSGLHQQMWLLFVDKSVCSMDGLHSMELVARFISSKRNNHGRPSQPLRSGDKERVVLHA